MRITEGIIYLAQPVLGRRCLSGAATIGTTWLEYTFTDGADEPGPLPDAEECDTPRLGWRLLIPMSNVTAVVMGSEEPSP